MTVNHSTIVNNTGFGINNLGGSATTVVSHTIIAQNGGAGTTRNVNATLSTGSSYNLVGNGDGAGITNGINGNLVGTTGDLLDPKLGLLADNGGQTKTHALLPDSPALDAIPGGSCAVGNDQRGVSRPQGTNCDIGAFEWQGSYFYLPLVTQNQ